MSREAFVAGRRRHRRSAVRSNAHARTKHRLTSFYEWHEEHLIVNSFILLNNTLRERERKKDGLILALSPGKNRTGSRTEEIRPRDYLSICFLRACAAGRWRRREKMSRRGNRNQERRGKGEGSGEERK